MARRGRRLARAVEVTRVARHARVVRVLRELGVVGESTATAEAAREFRVALEQLGTTFIKLGQLLSSRPDLLPDVYIEELGRLVDAVPPVPYAELEPAIVGDLGPDVFVRVDEEPIATASIAQIHAALLKDGREVVVKVRRPGVLEQVEVDLELVRSAAALAERASSTARLVQLAALADELEAHLRRELDLAAEADNTETIAALLAAYEGLVVPAVVRPWVASACSCSSGSTASSSRPATASPPSAPPSSRARSSVHTSARSRSRASTTPTRIAATCCSRPTTASRCSTSG